MFPTGSNVFVATNLRWSRQAWNLPSMDLTAFYGMQQRSSFLPYLSAYHPYDNFSMASYRSYFRFQHYFRSQLTLDPYSAFGYYDCLDAKNLYASLLGKYYTRDAVSAIASNCVRYFAFEYTECVWCLLPPCFPVSPASVSRCTASMSTAVKSL